MSIALALLLAVCLSGAHALTSGGGFFRQSVGKLIYERLDPIVQPGRAPSSHAHIVAGASGFAPTFTSASLRKSACTTASSAGDFSAYWEPMLFFAFANGSFQAVEGGMQTRMVAGTPTRTTFNKDNVGHTAFEFRCLGANGQTLSTEWPMTNCPNGLRAEINFPSCSDGRADSPDHSSHVAWPTGGKDADGSACPPGFPKRLPRLFVEQYYSIDPFKDMWPLAKNPKWPFVWAGPHDGSRADAGSNGNSEPYGYHGDFAFGWDAELFVKAIEGTSNFGGGNIDTNAPMLRPNPDKSQCGKTPSVDEPIFGLLPHLPGCGDIYDRTTGPRMRANCVDNPDVLEAVGYVGTPPSGSCSLSGGAAVLASASGFGWQGCLGYTDARPLTVNVAGGADSTTACLKACAAAGPQSCGVEFGGQCYGADSKIALGQVGGTCTMPCKADPDQSCGGPKSLDFYVLGASSQVGKGCKRTPAATYNSGSGAALDSPDQPGRISRTSAPGLTRTTSVDAAGKTSVFFASDPAAIVDGAGARGSTLSVLALVLAAVVALSLA